MKRLVCTFGVASEAITLTAASLCVFLQRPWSLVTWEQAKARVWRIGQDKPVVMIDVVTENSMEGDVFEALAVKGIRLEDVLQSYLRGK